MSSTKYEQNNEKPILSNNFKINIRFYFHLIFWTKKKKKKRRRSKKGPIFSRDLEFYSRISNLRHFLHLPVSAVRAQVRPLHPLHWSPPPSSTAVISSLWFVLMFNSRFISAAKYEKQKKSLWIWNFLIDCFCSWIELKNSIFRMQSDHLLSVMCIMEVPIPLGIEKSDGATSLLFDVWMNPPYMRW